jgi:predicted Fe-S protein YdhL (DUF1289 family)
MTIPMEREPIQSPCDKVCTVDPVSRLCIGCGRTLAEIEHWAAYSDGERTRIMAELPERMTAMRTRGAVPVRA